MSNHTSEEDVSATFNCLFAIGKEHGGWGELRNCFSLVTVNYL